MVGALALAHPAHALVNLALNQATSASSQDFGASSLANDGSTVATYPNIFQSGFDAAPYWIVDLGGSYTLNDIHVYQRDMSEDGGARALHNWTVSLYNGGTLGAPTGLVSAQTYNPTDSLSTPDVDLTTGIAGMIARFVKVSLGQQDYLALAEVQVFQQAAAQTAVPEPASIALLLGGFAAAGMARRGRRDASAKA